MLVTSPYLQGGFAPVSEEITAFDLPVTDRGAADLVILAAQDFGGEPVARVHLPARVPLGFHGSWIPDQ